MTQALNSLIVIITMVSSIMSANGDGAEWKVQRNTKGKRESEKL